MDSPKYAMQTIWFAPAADDIRATFYESVDRTGPCWLWRGSINSKSGYGYVTVSGKNALVHRVSWVLSRGPIPDGHQIDHICRVRSCVNPDHLQPVTGVVNMRLRSDRMDECLRGGHKRTPETWQKDHLGRMYCVPCREALIRRMRDESKQARAAAWLGGKIQRGEVSACPQGHPLGGRFRGRGLRFPDSCYECMRLSREASKARDREKVKEKRKSRIETPEQAANRKARYKAWRLAHPGYWKAWREAHPNRKASPV